MSRQLGKIVVIFLVCAVLLNAAGCGTLYSAISDNRFSKSDDGYQSDENTYGSEGAQGGGTAAAGDKYKAGGQADTVGDANGAVGANGSAGKNGSAGANGSAGTNGSAGKNGSAGTNGSAGANGSAGTNGSAGKNNSAGKDGSGGVTDTDAAPGHSVNKREENLAQIPHYETRYYISQFEDQLLDDFAQLYLATKNHAKECYFINKVTKEELDALIFALKYDCPELFCLDNIRTYYQEGEGERNIVKVNIDYLMDAKEYGAKLREAEAAVQDILGSCKGNAYKRRLAAYEYLTNECSYNQHTLNCGNAYGALVEKQTKCDGISLAYMWLLEEMGEECFVVAGMAPGKPEGHGWNMVRQGGKYYASDLTADLSRLEGTSKTINWYPAYNVSTTWVDEQYSISKTPAFFRTVSCDDMSQSYHAHNGSFIDAREDLYQRIYQTIDAAAHAEDNAALIQFETDEMYDTFISDYGDIVRSWAEESKCTNVEYTYGSLEHYRTVQLMLKAVFAEDAGDSGDAAAVDD